MVLSFDRSWADRSLVRVAHTALASVAAIAALFAACSDPPETVGGPVGSFSAAVASDTPTAAPVGSGFVATGSGYVMFIEWHKQGTTVSGTTQYDYAEGTAPNAKVSSQTNSVTGDVNGTQISLSFDGDAPTFGTFAGQSFTIDFPQPDGSLGPVTFDAASASQFNQALAALQQQVSATDAQAQQAADVQHQESVIDADAQTVSGDTDALGQDSDAAASSLGAFAASLDSEETDLATTAKAEQKVVAESKQSPADDPTVCSDADGVASDADGVTSDADGVTSDADVVEGAVSTVRNDIAHLQTDSAQLQQDESGLPTYQPNAPTQATIDQAIKSANDAVSAAIAGTNAAVDQANGYATTAYQDAGGANSAGGCGNPPATPSVQPHIS